MFECSLIIYFCLFYSCTFRSANAFTDAFSLLFDTKILKNTLLSHPWTNQLNADLLTLGHHLCHRKFHWNNNRLGHVVLALENVKCKEAPL